MARMSHEQYCNTREFYRVKGARAMANNDLNEADYCSGVVRGLDLAFQDGTAKDSVFNAPNKKISNVV
jgi:hypothetical protein